MHIRISVVGEIYSKCEKEVKLAQYVHPVIFYETYVSGHSVM